MGIVYEHIGALPQALTKEEEKKWITLYDQERDEKAREMLITHNLRLVAYVVSKNFSNTGIEFEELFSVGTIGLVKAVDTYVADKGVQLNTYISFVVKNEILMSLRSVRKKMGAIVVSLDEPINIDIKNNHDTTVENFVADDTCVEDEVVGKMALRDDMKKVNRILAKIDERKRGVFEKLWGINGEKETKQTEIAEQYGVSQSYVSRVNSSLIKDLGRELKK